MEIEYLRAVAVILVVVLHAAPFLELKPLNYIGAHTGVDLFFCISGYVIYRSFQPFLDQHRHDGHWWRSVFAFWIRRVFRLVPSAWLWLAISIACSWAFNRTGWFYDFNGTLKSAIFVITNVTNFAYAGGALGGNAQYWSLALEDQFYLLFPFFLFFFRGSARWIVLVTLIFVQALPNRLLEVNPYLWATRLDALMWGCLIAQFARSNIYSTCEPKFLTNRILALGVNASLIFLLVAVPHLPHFIPNFRVESTIAVVSAGLVFLASFDRRYLLPVPTVITRVMAWIGARSYGMYLIHIPLYGVIKDLWFGYSQSTAQSTIVPALAAIVLLPALAELNFRFVETPLRRKGKQIADRFMAKQSSVGAHSPPDGDIAASRSVAA
ncbi:MULTISPECIES: acyltransferase [unclassified Bradyrhizobium]|uniref:acyltransferase family protein n=1 Tax=unclassified Bradyrhizobium TaxID=2631580 RepID=UPI003390EFDB